ncbi:MAG: tRNA (guanosine(46)-N7)-methyltransferase TrmB [Prevotella sp.]|nr:tRNA (guanosine(46)-N7)-methyltransferase TrmB [Prevotella sp.]
MSKGKLAKFADMETYKNVFQYPYSVVSDVPFAMQGRWREDFFHNANPIILELGCGKGEYAVELAKANPDCNYIGVDIKGARMWTGATRALQEGIENVAFLRTNIEIIDRFFAPDEVQELWLTFSDPQMKNPRKRLTSSYFLLRYRRFLQDRGIIHLKTDSNFLFTYTSFLVQHNHLPVIACTDNLYANVDEAATTSAAIKEARAIQTYYEQMWLSQGLSIKYMQFLLPREGGLSEPDVEIELDEYRSYHRTKRSGAVRAR